MIAFSLVTGIASSYIYDHYIKEEEPRREAGARLAQPTLESAPPGSSSSADFVVPLASSPSTALTPTGPLGHGEVTRGFQALAVASPSEALHVVQALATSDETRFECLDQFQAERPHFDVRALDLNGDGAPDYLVRNSECEDVRPRSFYWVLTWLAGEFRIILGGEPLRELRVGNARTRGFLELFSTIADEPGRDVLRASFHFNGRHYIATYENVPRP